MKLEATVALLVISCLAVSEQTPYNNPIFQKLAAKVNKTENGDPNASGDNNQAPSTNNDNNQAPSTNNDNNQDAGGAQRRILGGTAVINQCQAPFNSVVNIIKTATGNTKDIEAVCTGTLLAPDLVVTAASCMFEGQRFLDDLSQYYAVVGDRYLQSVDKGGPNYFPEQRVSLALLRFHADFNPPEVICTWTDSPDTAGQQGQEASLNFGFIFDISDCRAYCDADPLCIAVTLEPSGAGLICRLYHQKPTLSSEPGTTYSEKSCVNNPLQHNIMLIQLATSVTLDDLCVQPMTRYDDALNTDSCPSYASSCTILGWGSTYISDAFEMNDPASVLQYGVVNVLTNPSLVAIVMAQDFPTEDYPLGAGITMIAKPFAGSYVGTCQYDHGSMVACPNVDGEYELRGVLSNHNRCDEGQVVDRPMYVTDIQPYKAWIDGCLMDPANDTHCPGVLFIVS